MTMFALAPPVAAPLRAGQLAPRGAAACSSAWARPRWSQSGASSIARPQQAMLAARVPCSRRTRMAVLAVGSYDGGIMPHSPAKIKVRY